MRLPTNLGETNSRSEERERESLGIVHIFTPIFILSLDYRTEFELQRFSSTTSTVSHSPVERVIVIQILRRSSIGLFLFDERSSDRSYFKRVR